MTAVAWGLLAFLASAVFSMAYEIQTERKVSSRKPVNITASQLTFERLKGLTLFRGKVVATHDSVTLMADEIRAVSQNREATADGHVSVTDPTLSLTLTCGNLEYQDLMSLMTAHDNPLMTSLDESGRPIKVSGRQMELDSEHKTVVINQDVEITHDDGYAQAQKATFIAEEDKFILEENPKIFVRNGQLTGRRIISKLGADRSVIVEGMAEGFFNPGGPATAPGGGGLTTPTGHTTVAGPTPVSTPVKPAATPGAFGNPRGWGK